MNILKRPMFFAATVCSIAAAALFLVKSVAFIVIAISLIILLVLIISKKYTYVTVLLAILLFTFGLFKEYMKIEQLNALDGEEVTGSFTVIEEPIDHGIFNSVIIKSQNCKILPNKTKLFLFDYDKQNFKIGDVINATLKVGVIDERNKYRLSNYGESIYVTANVVKLNKSDDSNPIYKSVGNIRLYVKNKVSSRFSGDSSGLLLALTTGDKTLLTDEFAGNIKTTGISHVVVVSGMHLAIIMAAIFYCVDHLFYNKYLRCLISLVAVILISAVCGFTMSIIRAGAMFLIAGLAPIFNRENDSLSSLLTAITIILIVTPFAIFNVSFQLSVLSTLAIIWVVPFYSKLIKDRFNIKLKIFKFLIDTFLCSTSAIIFTLPVTIKTFGYTSIVSPITNLVISYPVMIALVFNIVALVLSVIPVINLFSTVIFFISGICTRFMVFVVNLIADLPITVAVLPKNAFWWAITVIAIVVGFIYIYEFKRKRSDLSANRI